MVQIQRIDSVLTTTAEGEREIHGIIIIRKAKGNHHNSASGKCSPGCNNLILGFKDQRRSPQKLSKFLLKPFLQIKRNLRTKVGTIKDGYY
jgi:hypothetical protein